MSNEQNRPPEAESDTQDRSPETSSGAQDKATKDAEKSSRPVRPRSNALPLTICLLLAGAIGWLAWTLEEQQQRIAELSGGQQGQLAERFREQQAQLDARISEQQDRLDEQIGEQQNRFDERFGVQQERLDERFDERLEQQQAQRSEELEVLEDLVSNLREAVSETRSELERQTAGMDEIRDQITGMRMRLENVDTATQGDQVWMLAEVESLLRLAQQRLLMARDTRTAVALMQSADEILRDIDDSNLFPVREALANDIEALRSVPELDVEGGFVRLNAVMDRIDNLQLRNVTREQLAAAETVDPSAEGGSTLDRWLRELGELVSVRRLDEPLQGTISSEQGHFIRQNIRLLLEQAQLALWRGEADIYTGNIDQAMDYMERYFLSDDAEFRAATEALEQLRERPVSVRIPPASSGLTALRRVMESYERGDDSPAGTGNGQ